MSGPASIESGTAPVLAILPPGAEALTIQRLLAEEDVEATVRDPADGPGVWSGAASFRAVIIDESLEPAALFEALAEEWIPRHAPLFVLTRRLPDRDRYMAWLEAGAWDIVKFPLEGVALALRLRNILRGHGRPEPGPEPRSRYAHDALEQVADETLSLARRHDRGLQCAVVAVEGKDGFLRGHALLERLADATQRLVRRSDLIGIGDGLLFVLLPDTDEEGGRGFLQRLDAFLQERLSGWGLDETIRTRVVSASGMASGQELLNAAHNQIQATPRE